MRDHLTTGLLFGALSLTALGCGGDDESGEGETMSGAPASSGDCSKGAYPGDHDTLTLCGKGAKCMGVPLEEIRGYTSYEWDITVHAGDETDLTALSCLESVGGLTIGPATQITSLHGLEKIERASSVSVVKTDKLTSLAGLDSLTSTNEVTLSANAALTDIVGFRPGLTTRRLYVFNHPSLISLDGLAGVTIQAVVSFEGNESLSKCAVFALGARFPNAELDNNDNLEATCP